MLMNIAPRGDRINDPLYVVTAIFNPVRFNSRWRLYLRFKEFIERSPNAKLVTVEIAFGDREFTITESNNPFHVQLRTNDELWHKERAINIAISRLPLDWRYVAWIDGDVAFFRPDWANETLHQLQRYSVVQMFNEAIDLNANYNPLMRHKGFAACHVQGAPTGKSVAGLYEAVILPQGVRAWHPGFAWAMTKDAYNALGGLFDVGVLGAGDNHMAKAFIGQADNSMHKDISNEYRKSVLSWQDKALQLKKNLGFVDGSLIHFWHGTKASRKYWDRWRILVDTKFDPNNHLETDWQGLYRIAPQQIKLRDLIRQYFHERDEDALN